MHISIEIASFSIVDHENVVKQTCLNLNMTHCWGYPVRLESVRRTAEVQTEETNQRAATEQQERQQNTTPSAKKNPQKKIFRENNERQDKTGKRFYNL